MKCCISGIGKEIKEKKKEGGQKETMHLRNVHASYLSSHGNLAFEEEVEGGLVDTAGREATPPSDRSGRPGLQSRGEEHTDKESEQKSVSDTGRMTEEWRNR